MWQFVVPNTTQCDFIINITQNLRDSEKHNTKCNFCVVSKYHLIKSFISGQAYRLQILRRNTASIIFICIWKVVNLVLNNLSNLIKSNSVHISNCHIKKILYPWFYNLSFRWNHFYMVFPSARTRKVLDGWREKN